MRNLTSASSSVRMLPFALVPLACLAGFTAADRGARDPSAGGQDPKPSKTPRDEMPSRAEMKQRIETYTRPGPEHEWLERFVGTWDVEVVMTMGGGRTPFGHGRTEVDWAVDDFWLRLETRGAMEGPYAEMIGRDEMHSLQWIGYDRFARSYVATQVGNLDTAMLRFEGDRVPSGALVMYGTLDEYLTGEHDKMAKYVWRFESEDRWILEVHDLTIGETGTMVLESRYTRRDGD